MIIKFGNKVGTMAGTILSDIGDRADKQYLPAMYIRIREIQKLFAAYYSDCLRILSYFL